jgi:hypothetical protein
MKVDMSEHAVERRLCAMGELWELSVKLMSSDRKKRDSSFGRRSKALQIQDSIREVLTREWDPIGIGSETMGEYDSYIAPLYRVLVTSRSKDILIERLQRIERDELGILETRIDVWRSVAEKLLTLPVTLDR